MFKAALQMPLSRDTLVQKLIVLSFDSAQDDFVFS